MITYTTLETISYQTLYNAFMQAFNGFRITTEADYTTFCEMLKEKSYAPAISIGAFDSETGELVSFVLNSILSDNSKIAYDILTGTIPEYRRKGIAKNIFSKVKNILRENGIKLYTTEVLKSNSNALQLYLSIGFEIKGDIINTIKVPNGIREVVEYEIILKL